MLLREKRFGPNVIVTAAIVVIIVLSLIALAFGQTAGGVQNEVTVSESQTQVLKPLITDYRGISIGTTEAELLERMGTKPTYESEDDYFYILSEAESAQFLLDAERKVRVISITYSGYDSNAPTYQDLFGHDVEIKKTADGKIYNFVNYPGAGFWVAYYESSDGIPLVTITVQKL